MWRVNLMTSCAEHVRYLPALPGGAVHVHVAVDEHVHPHVLGTLGHRRLF
jgi:hypothetical protein